MTTGRRIAAEHQQRVSEFVRDMYPVRRQITTREEDELVVHLRGNQPLYDALTALIRSPIEARAHLKEPTDPLTCKSMLARDRELQFLLGRLEVVFHLPVRHGESEQPAE